jgi:hypothetical protein
MSPNTNIIRNSNSRSAADPPDGSSFLSHILLLVLTRRHSSRILFLASEFIRHNHNAGVTLVGRSRRCGGGRAIHLRGVRRMNRAEERSLKGWKKDEENSMKKKMRRNEKKSLRRRK